MAQNEIVVRYRVQEDGSLKKIESGAEKAAKSTDNLSRSRTGYNKVEKGAAQLTSNSTKAFAKQAQGIGSGLVPAYATLAANVFAVTAAFGVLQRAAQVEQLTEGLTAMGQSAGVAMKTISSGLVTATGNALSLEEAMRSTSLVMSSGFGAETIERLGVVAKNASIALGRDTADSLARLTRGAAKLEPELLDELGIMVRLDDATETYARQLGKTANQLTSFEKRQAFMNAVLAEGEKKYQAIGDSVDANPYDRLAASFNNLTKTLINFVGTPVGAFVGFLADNLIALSGVLVVFSKSVITAAIPALEGLGAKLATASSKSAALSIQKLKQSKAFTGGTKSAQVFVKALQSGENVEKSYAGAIRYTNQSIRQRNAGLAKSIEDTGRFSKVTREKTAALNDSKKTLNSINKAYYTNAAANISVRDASVLASAANGKFSYGYKKLLVQLRRYDKSAKVARANSTALGSAQIFVSNAFRKASLSVRFFGAALVNAIPLIGQIIFIVGLLFEGLVALNNAFKSDAQKSYEKSADELTSTINELAGSFSNLNKLAGTAQKYETFSTAFENIKKQILETNEAGRGLGGITRWFQQNSKMFKTAEVSAFDKLITSSPELAAEFKKLYPEAKTLLDVIGYGEGQSQKLVEVMDQLDKAVGKPAKKFSDLSKTISAANEPISKFMANFTISTPIDDLVSSFDDLDKVASRVGAESGEDFLKVFKEKAGTDLANLIGLDNIVKEASTSAGLITAYLTKGSTTAIDDIKKRIQQVIKSRTDELKVAQKQYQMEKANELAAKARLDLAKQTPLVSGTYLTVVTETNKMIDAQIGQLQAQLTTYNQLTDAEKQTEANKAKVKEIEDKIALLQVQRIEGLEEEVEKQKEILAITQNQNKYDQAAFNIFQKQIAAANSMISARKTIMEIDKKEANRASPFRQSAELTASDEYVITKKLQEEKMKAASEEFLLKIQMIDAEYDLLEVKMQMLKAEADVLKAQGVNIDTSAFDKAFAAMESTREASLQAAGASYVTTMRGIIEETRAAGDAAKVASMTATGSIQDRIGAAAAPGGTLAEGSDASAREKLATYANIADPMLEQLRQLGPEGELVSAAAQGAITVADSWMKVGEVFQATGDGMARGASVAAAVGQTFSAIGDIMSANSNAQIATIDKQIQAEQKRDGKSKESLAKIQALEKKKEAAQRKAFEQNKKVQMAVTIANTAAGIMAALAAPPIGLGPVAGMPLAIITGVMGAMQLAAIASTSYQGGGSAPSASGPSKISVGNRQNSVDLAKARSPSGELAYARGAQGTGQGMTNYTPAFSGMKYRAAGGNTAFMVGEQGPEMFIPERAGRIAPADEAQGFTGQPVNVNFSISAVDASGVEDLLMAQRGNLIGMIREAANAHGELFLETVNDKALPSREARKY